MTHFDPKRDGVRKLAGMLLSFTTVLGSVALVPTAASAQSFVTAQGGPGGGPFYAPCPSGEYLIGLDLKMADDVDAVRPICGVLNGPAVVERFTSVGEWHGGNGGGQKQLICPPGTPVTLGIVVEAEGAKTKIVDAVTLKCGTRSARQAGPLGGANIDGPAYHGTGLGSKFNGPSGPLVVDCPPNMLAVGIHGRSGIWLDAIGLLCAPAPSSQLASGASIAGRQVVHACRFATLPATLGRVTLPSQADLKLVAATISSARNRHRTYQQSMMPCSMTTCRGAPRRSSVRT